MKLSLVNYSPAKGSLPQLVLSGDLASLKSKSKSQLKSFNNEFPQVDYTISKEHGRRSFHYLEMAALSGSLGTFRFVLDHVNTIHRNLMPQIDSTIISIDDPDILRLWKGWKNAPIDSSSLKLAIQYKALKSIEALLSLDTWREQLQNINPQNFIDQTIQTGDVTVTRLLLKHGWTYSDNCLMRVAIVNGQMEILRTLVEDYYWSIDRFNDKGSDSPLELALKKRILLWRNT